MSEVKQIENRTTTGSGSVGGKPRASWVRRLVGIGPPLALVGLIVLFSLLSDRFFTLANMAGIAGQASILLVMAVGMTFVILLGGIDLSVEGVMAVSSLTVVLLATNDRNENHLGLLAVLAGVAVGALMGLANGLLHTKLRIPSFMVTLGVGAIGTGIATVLFAGRAPRLLDDALRSWGIGQWFGVSRLVFIAVVVVLMGYAVQRYTRIGRYAYVIGGDEAIARLSGISIAKYKTLAFVLSGSAAGLGGAMASMRLGVGDVQIGAGQMFATITAVVIGGTLLAGGRGGVLQTLIGALIIATLANGLILVGVEPYIQVSLQGAIIVVAVAATGWHLRKRTRVIK